MTIVKQLLIQLLLILLNALFAATELAMVSINEKKVRAQAEDGDKKAKKLLRVIEDPTRFLSAIFHLLLYFITVCKYRTTDIDFYALG